MHPINGLQNPKPNLFPLIENEQPPVTPENAFPSLFAQA